MGNELSGFDGLGLGGGEENGSDNPYYSLGYNDLNVAIKKGDLAEVRRFVEEKGLMVNGLPGCDHWDLPLTACTLESDGRCKHIARYLAARGAKGYDAVSRKNPASPCCTREYLLKLSPRPFPHRRLQSKSAI
jgi:hypothetical protein